MGRFALLQVHSLVGRALKGPERTSCGVLVSRLRGMVGGRCGGAASGAEERTGDVAGKGQQGPAARDHQVEEQQRDQQQQGQQLWVRQPRAHGTAGFYGFETGSDSNSDGVRAFPVFLGGSACRGLRTRW